VGHGPTGAGTPEDAQQLQERRDEWVIEIRQHHHGITRPARVFLFLACRAHSAFGIGGRTGQAGGGDKFGRSSSIGVERAAGADGYIQVALFGLGRAAVQQQAG
jgi:hypothetical protein